MKEKFKDNKLDTGLEHGEKDQTGALKSSASPKARPRFKLKFTDFAIDKFISSFLVAGKTKIRIYTSFDVSKHTALKGLTLCQYKKTMRKYFLLRFWFNGKNYKEKEDVEIDSRDFPPDDKEPTFSSKVEESIWRLKNKK